MKLIPVIFRRDKDSDEVVAVFPTEPHDYQGLMATCYGTIGQHSGCARGWYDTTLPASPAEVDAMKRELRSVGYAFEGESPETGDVVLKVAKRWRDCHDADRKTFCKKHLTS